MRFLLLLSAFPEMVKVMDGAMAGADGEALPNRFGNELFCQHDGTLNISSLGKIGGDRCR